MPHQPTLAQTYTVTVPDEAAARAVYAHVLRDQAVEVAQIFAAVVDNPSTLTSSC